MLDCAIVNGELHDGTGTPGRAVDIGIAGGSVVELAPAGALSGPAREQIDATGRIVTPGFIDPHTHMDAQLFWDPSGSPSLLHGVTSIVLGSCGFGVAPLAAGMEEYALRSLESVEEIPFRVTRLGVPMSWRSWPDYFDAVGALALGVNVAGFVPHSALRTGVLGREGLRPDIDASALGKLLDALDEALGAGAVGMSTSRGSNHTDANGDPVPSRLAGDDEIRALVARCAGRIWQINIKAKGDASPAGIAAALDELEHYRGWSAEASARLTWTPLAAGPGEKLAWPALLEFSRVHNEDLIAQVSPQAINGSISFDGPSFAGLIDGWGPAFAGYGDLSAEEKLARLESEAFRSALKASPQDPRRITAAAYDRWRVVLSPSHPDAEGQSLAALATAAGRHPVDFLAALAVEDELRTMVEAPLSNVDLDTVRALVTEPSTLFGLGDAGAHVKSITNYTYPTYVLSALVRDRHWLSLPDAIYRLTGQPAATFHLEGRGVVKAGAPADLCVIDLERLALGSVELVDDLPGGGKRLHRGATGYSAVIVNGETVLRDDVPTGQRPGQLLRV